MGLYAANTRGVYDIIFVIINNAYVVSMVSERRSL
jgi:hypothetical protein